MYLYRIYMIYDMCMCIMCMRACVFAGNKPHFIEYVP